MPAIAYQPEHTLDLETLLDVIARSNELSYGELLAIAQVDRKQVNALLKDLLTSRFITISGVRSADDVDKLQVPLSVGRPEPKVTISNRGFGRAMAL